MQHRCLWDGYRKAHSQLRSIAVSIVPDTLLAAKNEKRIGLYFWPDITLSNGGIVVANKVITTSLDGIPIKYHHTDLIGTDTQHYFHLKPLALTQHDHGDICTHEWRGLAISAGCNVLVMEVFADERYTGVADNDL